MFIRFGVAVTHEVWQCSGTMRHCSGDATQLRNAGVTATAHCSSGQRQGEKAKQREAVVKWVRAKRVKERRIKPTVNKGHGAAQSCGRRAAGRRECDRSGREARMRRQRMRRRRLGFLCRSCLSGRLWEPGASFDGGCCCLYPNTFPKAHTEAYGAGEDSF